MAPTGSGQHPVFVRTLKMAKPSSLFWRFSLLAHCHSLILPQPQFLVISLFACVMLRRLWNFIWLPLPKCSCFSPYLIPLLPWVDVRPWLVTSSVPEQLGPKDWDETSEAGFHAWSLEEAIVAQRRLSELEKSGVGITTDERPSTGMRNWTEEWRHLQKKAECGLSQAKQSEWGRHPKGVIIMVQ